MKVFWFYISVAVTLLVPSEALAQVDWTRPGWYVREWNPDVAGQYFLKSGPYSTQAACLAELARLNTPDNDMDYDCGYLSNNP